MITVFYIDSTGKVTSGTFADNRGSIQILSEVDPSASLTLDVFKCKTKEKGNLYHIAASRIGEALAVCSILEITEQITGKKVTNHFNVKGL